MLFTTLGRSYVGLIFIGVAMSILSSIKVGNDKDFELGLTLVITIALHYLDANLYIAKFIGVDKMLETAGWMHYLGVFLTLFACLIASIIIMEFQVYQI